MKIMEKGWRCSKIADFEKTLFVDYSSLNSHYLNFVLADFKLIQGPLKQIDGIATKCKFANKHYI